MFYFLIYFKGTFSIEEYIEEKDMWTAPPMKTMFPIQVATVAVPALLFSNIPGGCAGVK